MGSRGSTLKLEKKLYLKSTQDNGQNEKLESKSTLGCFASVIFVSQFAVA
ncbi:hypothetical protein ANO14919_053750 [Xylariales sp. No.14919]|nr:hypothetical protein ANO14919_053750 [Xylariales sp. No.14919]